MCLLLLIFSLNPMGSKYEGSLSCFASFGYRPFLLQTPAISPRLGKYIAVNTVNSWPDTITLGIIKMNPYQYKPVPEVYAGASSLYAGSAGVF